MGLFSGEERRGLVVLLPLLLIAVLLSVLARRRDEAPVMLTSSGEAVRVESAVAEKNDIKSSDLRPFDPNKAEYEELRQCGVPAVAAAGMVRWRRYGKVYRIKEDVALVSGVDDSLYARLKPYIVIGSEYAATERRYKSGGKAANESDAGNSNKDIVDGKQSSFAETHIIKPFSFDTVSAEYLTWLGFSDRQAEAVLRYRDAIGGIASEEQLRRCYVVSEQMADRIVPYAVFSEPDVKQSSVTSASNGSARSVQSAREESDADALVEINTADSATLRSVRGIGAVSVRDIMRYRELLGGFCSVRQLAEVPTVTEKNYELILSQIYCDSCKISKIDINFASPKVLARHPYVSDKALRRIVKLRQSKGGWSRIEEMLEDDIFTMDEAERLAPYLRFGLFDAPK